MEQKTVTLRLDEHTLVKLRALAKQECRSVNKQVWILIRDHIAQYEAQFGTIDYRE